MKIVIFYSWQMTTETRYNKNFISDCIENSIKRIKKKANYDNITIELIESTRGISGSPSISPAIIQEQIPKSDIFIADLSFTNQTFGLKQYLSRILGTNKLFINNCVIEEYGVAESCLGEKRIIGILNKHYGSPKDNPNHFHFDIRHKRFPLEYNYSKTTQNVKGEKDNLVKALTNALELCIDNVIETRRINCIPFKNIKEIEKIYTNEYIWNDILNTNKNQIISNIKDINTSIRILGLPGLGKTRFVIETLKSWGDLTKNQVLYFDYNTIDNSDLINLEYVNNMEQLSVVVLDNCSEGIHRRYIEQKYKNIFFVTISSNPEEIEKNRMNKVNYVIFKSEYFTDIIDKLLNEQAGIDPNTIQRLKEFSQGNLQMVELLIQSIKDGKEIVPFEDKHILNKLLGDNASDPTTRKILLSISLFNFIGFEEDLKSQIEYIVSDINITPLNDRNEAIMDKVTSIIQHYICRGIFENKGRYIRIRPLPLAIYLIEEWFSLCDEKKLHNILINIQNIENDNNRSQLIDAFSEQMKYLNWNPKANIIIEKLVGIDCPFDNAEVLNTELGSRLFRSFVEVNPVAVSNYLIRNFFKKTKDELLEYKVNRRNIIWIIEKLCFDRRTFNDSVKLLFRFAISENEAWGNNSVGTLKHLFSVFLPGTEASLIERFNIIDWAINKNEIDYITIALDLMDAGLNYGHFSRVVGAENQGMNILKDYQPKWEEIHLYWTNILDRVSYIIKSNSDYSEKASDVLCRNLRGLYRSGSSSLVLKYIEEIAILKTFNWDLALTNLKLVKKFEKAILTNEELSQIDNIIVKLTPTDFFSKYISLTQYYENDSDNCEDTMMTIIDRKIVSLVEEFAENKNLWSKGIRLFYTKPFYRNENFGKILYNTLENNKESIQLFINKSISTIRELKREEVYLGVFVGFIENLDTDLKENLFKLLSNNSELSYLLFSLIPLGNNSKAYLEILFDLIKKGVNKADEFLILRYDNILLREMSENELVHFSQRLFSYGQKGYSIVFTIYFYLNYYRQDSRKYTFLIHKECILKLGLIIDKYKPCGNFEIESTICSILDENTEPEFAIFINQEIISYFKSDKHNFETERIYKILITKYFDNIWNDLSNALLFDGEMYLISRALQHVLGAHVGYENFGQLAGILFDGNLDKIFEWCENNKDIAPIVLGKMIPIFDKKNSDFSNWNPICKKIIDEYGYNDYVLNSISANMGTYSWTGSSVPLIEHSLKLMQQLANHNIDNVRVWATKNISYYEKMLKRENIRDEERYIH